MPKWLQNIGKLMPTYQLSVIDKAVLHQTELSIMPFLNLCGWFIVLALVLIIVNKLQRQKGIVEA